MVSSAKQLADLAKVVEAQKQTKSKVVNAQIGSSQSLAKSANEAENLVTVIRVLSEKIEKQHRDNVKSQRYMFWATIFMALATAILAWNSFPEMPWY